MPSGMEMLLNSFGINPQEMRESIEGFMLTMKTAAEKINANQMTLERSLARIETKLERIQADQVDLIHFIEQPGETTRLTDLEGKDAHVLVTTEKYPQAMLDDAGVNVEG